MRHLLSELQFKTEGMKEHSFLFVLFFARVVTVLAEHIVDENRCSEPVLWILYIFFSDAVSDLVESLLLDPACFHKVY